MPCETLTAGGDLHPALKTNYLLVYSIILNDEKKCKNYFCKQYLW